MSVVLVVGATVSAEEVLIHKFDDGTRCCVLTETFINRTQYRDNRAFSVDVAFILGLGADKKNYSFRENDGLIYFSVDGGADNFAEQDALAEKIWDFGKKFLGIDYEVSYK